MLTSYDIDSLESENRVHTGFHTWGLNTDLIRQLVETITALEVPIDLGSESYPNNTQFVYS